MATRYSKEKYAHIKNLKNEPLSNLTVDSKKRKLGDEKSEAIALPPIHIAPSSPTPSLEVTGFSPLTIHAKGKGKVLGESLHITTDYLNTEEKVVVANSKVESIEVVCSKLRKDLIVAMNEKNDTNEKIKELTETLRVEKALVVQKDEEIQAALLKTDANHPKIQAHHSLAVDFSNLDFEKIDTEVLADEAKEQEETEIDAAMDKDLTGKDVDEGKDTDEPAVPLP
nr:hypothetical protein CFP56_40540 [Quercus suber]